MYFLVDINSTTCTCIACDEVTVWLTRQCVYLCPCFATLLTSVQGIGGVHASGYYDAYIIHLSLKRKRWHRWHCIWLACFLLIPTVHAAIWMTRYQLHAHVQHACAAGRARMGAPQVTRTRLPLPTQFCFIRNGTTRYCPCSPVPFA